MPENSNLEIEIKVSKFQNRYIDLLHKDSSNPYLDLLDRDKDFFPVNIFGLKDVFMTVLRPFREDGLRTCLENVSVPVYFFPRRLEDFLKTF